MPPEAVTVDQLRQPYLIGLFAPWNLCTDILAHKVCVLTITGCELASESTLMHISKLLIQHI